MTRRLIVSTLVTLDGVVQDPGGFGETADGGWMGPYFDAAAGRRAVEELLACDVFLCGRTTYEVFSAFWPKGDGPFADRMNAMPKLVASTTLTGPLDWNAQLMEGDVPEAVRRLKGEPGGDIIMYGSPTLMRTLAQNDLIDEYNLLVAPITLGQGMKLFTDGAERTGLRFVAAKPFDTGLVVLTYEPTR